MKLFTEFKLLVWVSDTELVDHEIFDHYPTGAEIMNHLEGIAREQPDLVKAGLTCNVVTGYQYSEE